MNAFLKTFNKTKSLCFRLTGNDVLEKYDCIWRKFEDLKSVNLSLWPIHNKVLYLYKN